MAGMDGILVDAGNMMSFDLFVCWPPSFGLFKHDDLNSFMLNSGNAAAEVSAVSLKEKKKHFRNDPIP